MATIPLDEIVVVEVAPLGAPGTGVTNAWVTTIRNDVDGLLAKPNPTVGTLTDVQLASLADGQALVWVAASNKWKNVAVNEAVAYVKNGNTSVILTHADRLNFDTAGFVVTPNGSLATQADISLLFGTTAGTVASGDHIHGRMLNNHWDFAATGVLSSGTRTLVTQSSSVATNGVVYDAWARLEVVGRNNINTGTVTLSIQIGTQAAKVRELQTVGGVPSNLTIEDERGFTGAGGPLTITATVTHTSSDPTDLRSGFVTFRARPVK